MQFPIRQEIEVLPADPVMSLKANEHLRISSNGKVYKKGKGLKLGFTVKESIGVAIVNPRGVAKGKKSVIVGE